MEHLRLRPATLNDTEAVFRWRNSPFIRMRGSFQREVQWDEHIRWFEETLTCNRRKMFIVLLYDKPIGQVRFDRIGDGTCVISAYVLQEFTGKGYGVQAIRHGCAEIFKHWNVKQVIACVRSDNKAARSAFIKAGFSSKSIKGCCPEAHFTLSLSR